MMDAFKSKLAAVPYGAAISLASASIGVASAGTLNREELQQEHPPSAQLSALDLPPSTEPQSPPSTEPQSEWSFDRALQEVLKREGGLSTDRVDRGNRAIALKDYGLNQESYDQYRDQRNLPKQRLVDISRRELVDFYGRDLFDQALAGEFSSANLRLLMIDTVANVGTERAVRFLQEALGGLEVDGRFGPATRTALNSLNSTKDQETLIASFRAKREEHYSTIREINARGVATNSGITQSTYDRFREENGEKIRDVRAITQEEIGEIYRTYWNSVRCDELHDPALRLLMFDAAVLHGPGNATRLLQRALGNTTVDGKIGPQTLSLANGVDNAQSLRARFLDERNEFFDAIVERNPSQKRFLNGWKAHRVDSLRELTNSFHTLHHTVATGDTLQRLADRYLADASRWQEIAQANGISLTAPQLEPGQKLSIPTSFREYTIQQGDTLSAIARKELNGKVSWQRIASFNGLTDEQVRSLRIGAQILLPER